MNRETTKIIIKDVELEVEFTWTPITRATREQPEEGGIDEVESVYCEGVDIIDLISNETIDDIFIAVHEEMVDQSFRTEED